MENQIDEAIRRAVEDLVRLGRNALLIETAFRLGPKDPGKYLVPEQGDVFEEGSDEYEAQKRNEEIELRDKLERTFDTALQILDYGDFRLKWFDKDKRRPGEIAELMAGELVKFTDAVQQITGKKGHFYNWRVEEYIGNEGYWDMIELMRKRGVPKVLIPKLREGWPADVKAREQMIRAANKRTPPKKKSRPKRARKKS